MQQWNAEVGSEARTAARTGGFPFADPRQPRQHRLVPSDCHTPLGKMRQSSGLIV
jgi:hypothetical protein